MEGSVWSRYPQGEFLSLGTLDILVWITTGNEELSCALQDDI